MIRAPLHSATILTVNYEWQTFPRERSLKKLIFQRMIIIYIYITASKLRRNAKLVYTD